MIIFSHPVLAYISSIITHNILVQQSTLFIYLKATEAEIMNITATQIELNFCRFKEYNLLHVYFYIISYSYILKSWYHQIIKFVLIVIIIIRHLMVNCLQPWHHFFNCYVKQITKCTFEFHSISSTENFPAHHICFQWIGRLKYQSFQERSIHSTDK